MNIVSKIGYIESFRPLNKEDYRAWFSTNKYAIPPEIWNTHDNTGYLQTLIHPLEVFVMTRGIKLGILFRRGFTWDTASVPNLLRSVVDNDHPGIMLGAMVHDALYASQYLGSDRPSCKLADKILYDIMLETGGKEISKRTYLGLSLGGYHSYKEQSEFDKYLTENYLVLRS
jgi:hypothetical protein